MDNNPTRILIVDDDPFVRDMLSMIVRSAGIEADDAQNGADALKKHAERPAGLIISDMNMPELDGLALIKKLREDNDDVPIIILTGNNQISYAMDAIRSGANDYLLKDENIQDTIILSVEKTLEKYRLRKQNLQLMADISAKNEKLERDRILAQKVQRNILPRELKFSGLEIWTAYRPSDKIGGDFFDAWETNGSVHFLIGDVSGHSTSAALIMAVSKGMLQSLGNTLQNPIEIISTANRMICDILGDSGMFVSLVYGVFHRGGNQLQIVSAGHNPVLLMDSGNIEAIASTGPVLGWDAGDSWEMVDCKFREGSSLFLYTDGLTEAKNNSGEEFGEGRLIELLSGIPPQRIVDRAVQNVSAFCAGEFTDDLTIFLIKRNAMND